MAWYKVGTINVTNNSTTVTGVGTAWVGAVLRGEGVVMPNGVLYEIDLVNSGTSITLARPYTGPTASGQSYSICPIQDYIKLLASQAAELVNAVNDTVAGVFGIGSEGLPSIRTAADPNTGLNLLGGDELSLVTGGVDRFKISPTGTPSGDAANHLLNRSNHSGTQPVSTITGLQDALNQKADISAGATHLSLNSPEVPTAGRLQVFQNLGAPEMMPDGEWWSLLRIQHPEYPAGYWQDFAMPFVQGGRPKVRQNNAGTKSPWRELAYTYDIAQAMANLVGTMAGGSIIESGSNANGTYTKFADGTLICIGQITIPATALYAGINVVWTLPTAFADGSYALQHSTSGVIYGGSIASAGDIVANGVVTHKTSETCLINMYTYKFATDPVVFSLTAIGRWK